eukprot:COSAG02_NODE_13583_length_1376_cov_1.619421_1_plen_156_part_00
MQCNFSCASSHMRLGSTACCAVRNVAWPILTTRSTSTPPLVPSMHLSSRLLSLDRLAPRVKHRRALLTYTWPYKTLDRRQWLRKVLKQCFQDRPRWGEHRYDPPNHRSRRDCCSQPQATVRRTLLSMPSSRKRHNLSQLMRSMALYLLTACDLLR